MRIKSMPRSITFSPLAKSGKPRASRQLIAICRETSRGAEAVIRQRIEPLSQFTERIHCARSIHMASQISATESPQHNIIVTQRDLTTGHPILIAMPSTAPPRPASLCA
jgi:hypothetical protein